MRKHSLLLSALSILFFASCKKDSSDTAGNANPDILGNYKFISLTANTTSTKMVSGGGMSQKTITRSTYTTTENSGTMRIEPTKMTSKDIAYSISTTATSDIYEDGVFIDSFELPFDFTAPASSASSEYKWITKDSVYFTNGYAFYDGSTPVTTGGNGAKLRLEGDKLYLNASKEQNSTTTEQGYQVISNDKASVIAIYQKQ